MIRSSAGPTLIPTTTPLYSVLDLLIHDTMSPVATRLLAVTVGILFCFFIFLPLIVVSIIIMPSFYNMISSCQQKKIRKKIRIFRGFSAQDLLMLRPSFGGGSHVPHQWGVFLFILPILPGLPKPPGGLQAIVNNKSNVSPKPP